MLAAGATKTVTPFAVLPPAPAAGLPVAARAGGGASANHHRTLKQADSGREEDERGATHAATAEPLESARSAKADADLSTPADSRARQQTLVFIGQDLDKVRRPAAMALALTTNASTNPAPAVRTLPHACVAVAGSMADHRVHMQCTCLRVNGASICSKTMCNNIARRYGA